jgi:hypothetical protein
MAQGRAYTVTSGLIAVTATTQTSLLFATAGATVTADVLAVRISCPSGSSPTYPANSSVKFTLATTTGGTGATSVTPNSANGLEIAANTVWTSGVSGQTLTKILWEQDLAFAAGANWGEIFIPGWERRLNASTQFGLFVTLSATSTATDFEAGLDFVE